MVPLVGRFEGPGVISELGLCALVCWQAVEDNNGICDVKGRSSNLSASAE